MKLVALMPVRSEEWILNLSARAALRWCDGLVILDHASNDSTPDIVRQLATEYPGRIHCEREDSTEWTEMQHRQRLLQVARECGATHIALVDADEIPTANIVDRLRGWCEQLERDQALELPMLAMRDWDHAQDDGTVWSGIKLSLAFKDRPVLTWAPRSDGYQHHQRLPYGIQSQSNPLRNKRQGGIMHVQWCHARRILAKHVLYRMSDWLRWPERKTARELNSIYDEALMLPGPLWDIPSEWWEGYDRSLIRADGVPWQEEEIRRLLSIHGRERFGGLSLHGF